MSLKMMENKQIPAVRTDLALEAAEPFKNENNLPHGVTVEEDYDEINEIRVTVVSVTSDIGAKKLGKPVGKYITVETPHMDEPDEGYHQEITKVLMQQLLRLVPEIQKKKILVAGIGNREITPDALGPLVVEHLFITRHLFQMYPSNASILKGLGNISAIAPGVMGQTGMEGQEIIHGIIEETKPEALIVIDALAARSTQRLNRTIQLTDTGIHPGAGIGNHRNELTEKTLGIPVIAIGIPTVIDAATIVTDTMQNLLNVLKNETKQRLDTRSSDTSLKKEAINPKYKNLKNAEKNNIAENINIEKLNVIKDMNTEKIAENENSIKNKENNGSIENDRNKENKETQNYFAQLSDILESFNIHEQHALMREVMDPGMMDMFVTPKDIDETIGRISFTISEAINGICHAV